MDACLLLERLATRDLKEVTINDNLDNFLIILERISFLADVCSYALCTSCTVNDGCVILKIWEYISRVV